jgi:hypothetical protein
MNIRKTLLLVLVIVIASLGLTACEQKSEPAPTEQAAEAVEEAAEATEEAAEAMEEAAEEHPTDEHPTGEHPQ